MPLYFNTLLKRKAAALIIVLAFLVLLTVLVVAFYSSATIELASASSYANGANARSLGDTAVQIVQAQIAAATSGTNASGQKLLWASQPGMIRTWNNGGGSGSASADTFYKLFSSPAMVVTGGSAQSYSFSASGDAPPGNWAGEPEVYCDLNMPVVAPDPNGPITLNGIPCSARYPILDPTDAVPFNSDPTVTSTDIIEGFEMEAPPGPYTTNGYTYPVNPAANPAITGNPAPMPVQWIYLLADGTPTVPAAISGSSITQFNPAPTKSNPLASRVAFWTDDETAKVNLNTASEGTFWDIPRAVTNDEYGLVLHVPVQNEFQRVPGHPAGVCLSTVLGSLLPRTTSTARLSSPGGLPPIGTANSLTDTSWTTNPTYQAAPSDYALLTRYYDLAPRINYIGSNGADETSQGGTYRTANDSGKSNPPAIEPVTLDSDRLYAGVDELYFKAPSAANAPGSVATRAQNYLGGSSGGTLAEKLSQFRFFLTTDSRADETTPINTPKVAVWPEQYYTSAASAKDAIIAKASTLAGRASTGTAQSYYFQRLTAYNDRSNTAYANLSCVSGTADYGGIPRNQSLYNYLESSLGTTIPGYGGNFQTKWSQYGVDCVLTEIFDFIRSQVNVMLCSVNGGPAYQYSFTNAGFNPPPFGYLGQDWVAPIQIRSSTGTMTQGFGRSITISEMALNFTVFDNVVSSSTIPTMQAYAFFQPYSATPSSFFPCARLQVSGLDGLMVTGYDANSISKGTYQLFPGVNSSVDCYFSSQSPSNNKFWRNAFWPYFSMLVYPGGTNSAYPISPCALGTTEAIQYPFATAATGSGNLINVTGWASFSVASSSGTSQAIMINVRDGAAASLAFSGTLQTINMTFPGISRTTMPVDTKTAGQWANRMTYTTANVNSDPSSTVILPGDITRSIVLNANDPNARGDLRVLALTPDVPSGMFTTHPRWNDVVTGTTDLFTGHFAHSLRQDGYPDTKVIPYGVPSEMNGTTKLPSANTLGVANNTAPDGNSFSGGLAAGITLSNGATPLVPISGTASTWVPKLANGQPGDFGSNYGDYPDGAIVADGDFTSAGSSSGYAYFAGYYDYGEPVPDDGTYYEPNRMISSPAVFGDLLTTDSNGHLQGWQSLLFNPAPAADATNGNYGLKYGSNKHPGAANPPDYLIMDYFWMPQIEPYALSEAFATAGKINPNYQIAPFGYIHRSTGLRAALKSVRLGAILDTDPTVSGGKYNNYKPGVVSSDPAVGATSMSTRFDLDLSSNTGTIAVFDNFFDNGQGSTAAGTNVLRTASEICSLPMVPKGPLTMTGNTANTSITPGLPASTISTFWSTHTLTSSTLRDSVYKEIYPRITTKSNTYTVHYWVQTIRQTDGNYTGWNEATDSVTGQFRGSTTIERYLDPSNTSVPDYTNLSATNPPLSQYYQFRTVRTKQFIP